MRKLTSHSLLLGALVLAGCAHHNHYTIEGHADEPMLEGAKVYLVDYATQDPTDSTFVLDGAFSFEGDIEEAYMGMLYAVTPDGNGAQTLIAVEGGKIYADLLTDSISGTLLNDRLYTFAKESHQSEFSAALQEIYQKYATAPNAELRHLAEVAYDRIDSMRVAELAEAANKLFESNKDNILGAYAITLIAKETHPSIADLELKIGGAAESVKSYAPLQKIMDQLRALERTSVGQPFVDIDGIDPASGETVKLSTLAAGNLAVVDFWASWCRPCRQEISENLIPLHKKYNGKGVQIIGVDVMDTPEGHAAAVKQMGIAYPQMVDTTRNAVNTYGISGIPQIMLISPDGTILARDLRGEAIEQAITAARNDKKSSQQ